MGRVGRAERRLLEQVEGGVMDETGDKKGLHCGLEKGAITFSLLKDSS